jgi:hypothetical protein
MEDIWICDSGACGHYCKSSGVLLNVEEIKHSITVGNGKSMIPTKVGSLKFQVIQVDGSGIDLIFHEVKFVPKLWVDFFSIKKAFKNDYILSDQGLSIF